MTSRSFRSIRRLTSSAAVVLLAGVASGASAQEGFPLDGTWRAQLDGDRTVVIVMKWDGENVNGMVNPGPSSMPLAVAELDPSDWGVQLEADTASGGRIVVAGTLVDIGSYNRRIVGTWTEDGATADLELRRE